MKIKFLKSVLFSLVIIASSQQFAFAEQKNNSNTNEQTVQKNEPLREDEEIAFMQKSETVASSEPGSGGLLLRTLGAMFLIVGLIFAGAWGMRKLGFGNSKTDSSDTIDLTILNTVSLGSGRTISTLRFGERILLVGSTSQTFTLLADESENHSPVNVKPMSVAEMLAENDENSFAQTFSQAKRHLETRHMEGAQI